MENRFRNRQTVETGCGEACIQRCFTVESSVIDGAGAVILSIAVPAGTVVEARTQVTRLGQTPLAVASVGIRWTLATRVTTDRVQLNAETTKRFRHGVLNRGIYVNINS